METTNITTGKVRLSYANVWSPAPVKKPTDKPKYKCMLIISKSDTATVDALKKMINEHIASVKSANGGKLPNGFKRGLRDGDAERPDDENLVNSYFLNCTSIYPPGIVDKAGRPITDQSKVYSGCYIRANINVFTFKNDEGSGVSFGLNHIQFWADGPSLGGGAGVSTAEAFATPIEDEEGEDWL